MRRTLFFLGLVIPAFVFALEFVDHTKEHYTDAPFIPAESAAINILTEIGAVEGNPDGSFAPERTLNRAEFLKIVLRSDPAGFTDSGTRRCFPDVALEDWFGAYVCSARERNIVEGYPDGLFHPEREVNYAEALKILSELYYDDLIIESGDPWFAPYFRAAAEHATAFPGSLKPNSLLTRGQMARLAAAYRAEAEGFLEQYRAFERGEEESSSAFSSASSDSFSSSLPEASSSSFSSAPRYTFPAKSNLLLLGSTSQPLWSGLITPDEEIVIRRVELTFWNEVDSIAEMLLITSDGEEHVVLKKQPADAVDNKYYDWEGEAAIESALHIFAEKPIQFGIVARLKARDEGGFGGEVVDIKSVKIFAQNAELSRTTILNLSDVSKPRHSIVQTQIHSIQNALESLGILQTGAAKTVAAFTISGALVPGTELSIRELDFAIDIGSVVATNWTIQGGTGEFAPCSYDAEEEIVECANFPWPMGVVEPGKVFTLRADVKKKSGATTAFLQASLLSAGSPEIAGAIRWSDGTSNLTWIDGPSPLFIGTRWE